MIDESSVFFVKVSVLHQYVSYINNSYKQHETYADADKESPGGVVLKVNKWGENLGVATPPAQTPVGEAE